MGSDWSIAPYFLVEDVVATAGFYRDKLGFRYDRFWGDPPNFCMVKRSGITIMLSQLPERAEMNPNHSVDPREPWDAYIWVNDADVLFDEFTTKGVNIARPICDQPYGCRDFDIEDCNGYRLCFGHDMEARRPSGIAS
ncbi:MAG TPA: VOC family protein [Bryobacteraceae bacterium]|jgi:predicted enzyme related to lactoylglutathione lyase|nr:VOC family protein [Bryobacteraceae bacterium]